ncbi:MAG: carbamate kinase [Solirubrobacterales bacterium]
MRVLIALGGNALLRRSEPADAQTQRRNVEAAAAALAEIAREHEILLTHGNGPQVGLLALQSESYGAVPPYPLDVLGAESEGMIGYMLEVALRNARPGKEVVTVLTQVVVDAGDPAFQHPSKPVGPVYPAEEAERLAAERGWALGRDGEGRRRLVPSPEPRALVELRSLELLVSSGVLLICAGGGGIPVAADEAGMLSGVEAVVDKDLTAALLATRLGAEVLVMLTDVDAVRRGYRTEDEWPIGLTTPERLRREDFEAGSIGPKVEAACRFVEAGGGRAAIGELGQAAQVLAGETGTQVTAGET